jgi:hypothetical protein
MRLSVEAHNFAPGDAAWQSRAEVAALAALAEAGRPAIGPTRLVKSSGRSHVMTVPTGKGIGWIKHSYRLPPGEEVVLRILRERWPERLPGVIASWPGGLAMESLPGCELSAEDPLEDWVSASRAIAAMQAGETTHAGEWLELGVRDRRPPTWAKAIEALRDSPVVRVIDSDVLRRFDSLIPAFVSRYVDAFTSPATLIAQDSGCCNIHIASHGPIFFDWADVVIGHPVFSCDRLLDQAQPERHDAIIDAFIEPLRLTRAAFDALRRSNVLHEVLRYHDELAYLAPQSEVYETLVRAVQSQIQVLVEHECSRAVRKR